MKLYVFDYVYGLTHNYHDEGGLVVVAKSKKHARQLVREAGEGNRHSGLDAAIADKLDFSDADVYQVSKSKKPRVYVFPNAGCC